MEDPFPETLLSRSDSSKSPEFEFWVVRNRNPCLPEPELLFSEGLVVPLHLLNEKRNDPDGSGPEVSTRRWKGLFRKKKKSVAGEERASSEKVKKTKLPLKGQVGSGSAAELNIHLWPFSRSRSGGRKVSSAPCSRSNSAGGRSSPGRAGVHLGRTSPVRRTGSGRKSPAHDTRRSEVSVGGAKRRVSVPVCRNHFSCRSNENSAAVVADGGGGGIFNIRNLFARKVY